jgi:uncharacterized protein YjbJ (UPF0337 family)
MMSKARPRKRGGKVSGDEKTGAEGKVDQARGDVKEAVDDVKEVAKR